MTTEGLFRGPGLASQLSSVLSLTPGAQTTNQKQTGQDRGNCLEIQGTQAVGPVKKR